MALVIRNASHSRNDLTDPTQRPEVRIETVGACSLQQGLFNRLQVFTIQTGVPAGAARSSQGFHATSLPHLVPAARTLSTHLKQAHNVGLFLSLAKQPTRLLSTVLKPVIISSSMSFCIHVEIIDERNNDVNILCEIFITILYDNQ